MPPSGLYGINLRPTKTDTHPKGEPPPSEGARRSALGARALGARASGARALGPRGSGLGPRARASGLGRSGLGARKTNSCFFLRFQEYIHINIYIYIENFLLSDPVFRLRNTSPPIHPSHVSNCGRPPCQTCRY